MTVRYIYKVVDDLLASFGPLTLPVKVEDIARFMNIKVVPFPLDNDVSGVLVITPENEATIGYNQHESRTRRRFTVAHELGHFMLHKTLNSNQVFVDNNFKVLFRSKVNEDEPQAARLEIEANTFAAALLMPEQLVYREIESINLDLGDEDAIKDLSKRFDVSSTAMYYRLVNMKVF